MEKRIPHYALDEIKAQMMSVREMHLTTTALNGIRSVGMSRTDALAVIKKLTHKNFYKSMTTHRDHSIWQDVYQVTGRELISILSFSAPRNIL